MRLSDPIVAIDHSRIEDRTSVTMPVWEQDVVSRIDVQPMPWAKVKSVAARTWSDQWRDATMVTVCCTTGSPLLEVAVLCARDDRRTYLVGPSSWRNDSRIHQLLYSTEKRLLARLVPAPPGDFIVVDRGESGIVLAGADPANPWLVPLPDRTAADLFDVFTDLFWHEAVLEALPGSPGGAFFQRPLRHPFDAEPRSSIPGSLVSIGDGKGGVLLPDAEVVVAPDGVLPDDTPSLLLTPPGPEGFDALSDLSRRGTRIAWFDADLPRMAVSRHRVVLETGPQRRKLRLELPEAAAAIDLLHVLAARASEGAWCFHADRALGDVRATAWRAGANKPEKVIRRLALPIIEVHEDLSQSFGDALPEQWHEPPPMALEAEHRWRIVPPTAPADAVEDPLIALWESVNEHAEGQVRRMRQTLRTVTEDVQSARTRFVGPLPSLEGFETRCGRIERVLDRVAERPLSDRPDEAAELQGALVQAGDDLEVLVSEIALTAAEAEQREAHERRLEKLHADLADLDARKTGAEAELAAAQENQTKKSKKQATRLKRSLSEIEKQRRRIEQDLDRVFRFEPPLQRPTPRLAPPQIPCEALPPVGVLLVHEGTRYLVVLTWHQWQAAREDADRLGAEIVAGRKKHEAAVRAAGE